MKAHKYMPIYFKLIATLVLIHLTSCNTIDEYTQKPELESLQQGLKTTAAVGYCASIAMMAIEGRALPDNVIQEASTGLIYVKVDEAHPLPFNKGIGDIVIAYLWSGNAGLMSILLSDIDLLEAKAKLCGLYLVPFTKQYGEDEILAMFAKQNIIIGYGSDTLLDMSSITDIAFNSRVAMLNAEKPDDPFVAIKQNIWFINVNRGTTYSNAYDDDITTSGGGQILEASGASGGVVYHALINAKLNYTTCSINPTSGYALSQNFKAGGEPYIDLGGALLSFHNTCDGKAHVDVSTGKYVSYNNRYISLGMYQ